MSRCPLEIDTSYRRQARKATRHPATVPLRTWSAHRRTVSIHFPSVPATVPNPLETQHLLKMMLRSCQTTPSLLEDLMFDCLSVRGRWRARWTMRWYEFLISKASLPLPRHFKQAGGRKFNTEHEARNRTLHYSTPVTHMDGARDIRLG